MWNTLYGIDFDKIKSDYKLIINLLSIIIKLRRSSQTPSVLVTVNEFENTLTTILEISYPDSNDIDLLLFKKTIVQMKTHIIHLKNQLS